VFDNRVLRKKFVGKREKVTGRWEKLHNEELTISSLLIISWGIRRKEHAAPVLKNRNTFIWFTFREETT
jgi:hypothetical protein